MTTMYASRLARFDLLRANGHLARYLTKWGRREDAKLHRLIFYIHHALDQRMIGFTGDKSEALWLGLYCDADFAGDKKDCKSTSGVFLALLGPHTFFPLSAVSKKQTAVSHSSTEAEIVGANEGVRTVGIPAIDLWCKILRRDPRVILYEDNQATLRILQTGKFS